MPQLDLLIFKTGSFFAIFFLLGYFFFLKHILSIITFELKYKSLIELYYLDWLSTYYLRICETNSLILKSLLAVLRCLQYVQLILSPQVFVFGVYNSDLLVLKLKLQ